MKCQLQISTWCKKVFRKDKVKIIDGKECCGNCFWLQKEINAGRRKPIPKTIKKTKVPKSSAFKYLDYACEVRKRRKKEAKNENT